MPVSQASQLLVKAEAGQKLTASQRRHTLQYLQGHRPHMKNTELAELFGVSERMIRVDRQKLRKDKAAFLKKEMRDDVGLVVADIVMDFEKQVSDLEKSKAKAKEGSKTYVDHCNSIFKMRLAMVEAMQTIGVLPKNMGHSIVERFDYTAVVHQDGSAQTLPTAALSSEASADMKGRQVLEAEFETEPSVDEVADAGQEAN